MKLAVIGATGLVGQVILEVLSERNLGITELIPVASDRSVGKTIVFKDQTLRVRSIQDALSVRPTMAIFSAGGTTSKKWAPEFAEMGTIVIDNSSAWRMDPDKKLIVPEINGHILTDQDRIIANPNCSTIQMVVALHQLHERYRLDRLVISTYQSVSGTGAAAVQQLFEERSGRHELKVYPHPIDLNCLPHGGDFLPNGYTTEEMKLVHETRKIFDAPDIDITATVVRVPVVGGHSESVNATFHQSFDMKEVMEVLRSTPGVALVDDPSSNQYPMPIHAHHRDEVYVGRVRRDESHPSGLNLWIVADNLRKGAATNAVQIAECLLK